MLALVIVLLVMIMGFILYYNYGMNHVADGQATAYLIDKKMRIVGTVRMYDESGGVRVVAEVSGLEPDSRHGFHITEYSDIENGNGPVYNPEGSRAQHGCPDSSKDYQAGDLGNIVADKAGLAFYDWKSPKLSLGNVVGRTVVMEVEADDCLPDRPSGVPAVMAQGGIGIQNTATRDELVTTKATHRLKRANLRTRIQRKDSDFLSLTHSPIWGDQETGIDRPDEEHEKDDESDEKIFEEDREEEEDRPSNEEESDEFEEIVADDNDDDEDGETIIPSSRRSDGDRDVHLGQDDELTDKDTSDNMNNLMRDETQSDERLDDNVSAKRSSETLGVSDADESDDIDNENSLSSQPLREEMPHSLGSEAVPDDATSTRGDDVEEKLVKDEIADEGDKREDADDDELDHVDNADENDKDKDTLVAGIDHSLKDDDGANDDLGGAENKNVNEGDDDEPPAEKKEDKISTDGRPADKDGAEERSDKESGEELSGETNDEADVDGKEKRGGENNEERYLDETDKKGDAIDENDDSIDGDEKRVEESNDGDHPDEIKEDGTVDDEHSMGEDEKRDEESVDESSSDEAKKDQGSSSGDENVDESHEGGASTSGDEHGGSDEEDPLKMLRERLEKLRHVLRRDESEDNHVISPYGRPNLSPAMMQIQRPPPMVNGRPIIMTVPPPPPPPQGPMMRVPSSVPGFEKIPPPNDDEVQEDSNPEEEVSDAKTILEKIQ